MKNAHTLIVVLLMLLSCTQREPSEVAARVAKQYYEQLLSGDYEAFVDGIYHADTITPDYRSQLVENMRKFIAEQNKRRKGIQEVNIEKSEVDSARHTADVYLKFQYGDNTSERVLVPMTELGGTWYLR